MAAHQIKVKNHASFDANGEPTLLDALELNGVPAPYNCRAGYCGACRVRLVVGEVRQVVDSLLDPPPGEIFTCCCQPKSDLIIELLDD